MPRSRHPLRRLLRRVRAPLVAGLMRVASALISPLPHRAAQAWGRALGRLAFYLAGRDRRRTLDHLAIAFPERSPAERRDLAKASFRHLGALLGEFLWLLGRDAGDVERLVETVGWERVEAARADGRSILIVSGHCGNWELIAALANVRGLGMKVVARALDDEPLQDLGVALRSRFGSETIERGKPGAARKLLEALRSGALAMLIDQDTKVDSVFVPFFGRLASTPVGAAKIAIKRHAAVFPTFTERLGNGRHRLTFLPELEIGDDQVEATARMTATIEEQIRRRPEQWVWMHRRWRRRPEDE